jgi:phospholipase C
VHLLRTALTNAILMVIITSILSGTSLISVAAASAATVSSSNFSTATPIKHLVIIFQENISFDHYFATYPNATNPPGEPRFSPLPNTSTVNGLTGALLTNNTNGHQPFRFDRSQAATCDMNHGYTAEQNATNGGLLDKFVNYTSPIQAYCMDPDRAKLVMGYYDGNTVTALWNYAQHFAMSDNFFSTTFGPSIPGHLNLISGQTHGAMPANIKGVVNGTVIANPDPLYDNCSDPARLLINMSGANIGNLLNAKDVTWGWFSDGFRLPNKISSLSSSSDIKVNCNARQGHMDSDGEMNKDYYPDVEPFQYYKSTANPNHLPPTSNATIGHKGDQANHQYDLGDFWTAAYSGTLPAVSFIKAATYQQGHPELSDPLKEQTFLVNTLNHLQRTPQWNSTAVIITYDDSDGWYDHVMPPIVSQSNDPIYDGLLGKDGLCGHAPAGAYQDRCGYGPRLPFLVVSPHAKINYVDHQIIDQTSIIRFIEDNWNLGHIGNQSFDVKAGSILNMFNITATKHYAAAKLFLNDSTGLER